ncbi:ZIP family metal transporter [Pseudomonas sp. GV071]|jgi:ZIP family zinc transporter|uniref:ZIP family metal transporter n=1 Tax=Pseudomonas sp. GV071 TaxID=2135754 RepID=UPI000D36CD37|nr:ZIP family metal transporter [Pseudomonas sp. GV071]PTQ73100.1 ZIP family zinc transporter [Pseudomonas sp. GV071]
MPTSLNAMRNAWVNQAHSHPYTTLGFAAAGLAVLVLVVISIYNAFQGDGSGHLSYALLGGLAGFGATAAGAVFALTLGSIKARTQDTMLGFAAGMMLAASSFSLILPGLAAAKEITGNGPMAALTVVVGLGLGVLLMLGLDRFTPHEHDSTGPCGPEAERINRVWLFVLAVTLHNIPEGMAIGVSFAGGDMNVGLPLTTAIAIQDIPEGLAVAMALRATGMSSVKAAVLAILSGAMEPLGALIGIGVSSGFALAYPISMGLAAGAMIFVVSHEVIPETHRNGHQTPATLGLMAGFAVMMFLDTALG